MKVIDPVRPAPTPLPGVDHVTLACGDDGLSELSLWRQFLAPGGQTPVHRHDCDEVVLCVAGVGEVRGEGRVERFGAGSTVVLPAGREHQLVNAGAQPLETIGILAATPVVTRGADGVALALPWRS